MSYTNVYPTRINWENEPSISSPINATNLNKIDYAVYQHDRTLETWDTTKANQSDLLLSVKSIDYDTDTGVFVFTWQNGTTKTVDLNIEKIPVSFSMDANGVITMTTDDGTTYTADVGALIKTYTFTDSSEIDFTVTTDASGNKTITAGLVSGSITGDKLEPNYLANCQSAANSASASKTAAEGSAEDAEAWAVGQRNGVDVTSGDPTYHNNSKYWSQQTSSKMSYADNGVLGAKNLLPNNAVSQTLNGVTFTVNSDGSITANGTATANANASFAVNNSTIKLKKGTYIFTALTTQGSASTFDAWTNNWGDGVNYFDRGDGVEFTISSDQSTGYVAIRVYAGQTVSNLVFKPMIRLATDTDSTYQPYAMTNKELTDVKANKSDLASISISGTTNNTGSAIARGTYFYLNGVLVKTKADIANGATLTANTNYEAVTAGALNDLNTVTTGSMVFSSDYFDVTDTTNNVSSWRRIGKTVTFSFQGVVNATIPNANINLASGIPVTDSAVQVGFAYDITNGVSSPRLLGQVRVSSGYINYPFNTEVQVGTRIRIIGTYICDR